MIKMSDNEYYEKYVDIEPPRRAKPNLRRNSNPNSSDEYKY